MTPDSFLVSKVTREIVRRQIGDKATEVVADPAAATTVARDVPEDLRAQPCLSDEEIGRLAEIGRRIEAHYARPQDVEWAIDRALGELFILQSQARDRLGQQAAGAAGREQRDGDDRGDDDRPRRDAEGMSDSPDLTPDDVKEILRLVDESQFDEFELETPRLTIRFRRGEAAGRRAPGAADPAPHGAGSST